MNTRMMEGLMGASSNIQLSGAPMSVYRQASVEGDTEKMKRALSCTSECTKKAAKCQEKLDEGMKTEAKAEREKAKLEREAAIERRLEERGRTEESAEPSRPQGAVQVQISEAAKAALENRQPVETAEPVSSKPVIYTPAGEISAVLAETGSNASFFA